MHLNIVVCLIVLSTLNVVRTQGNYEENSHEEQPSKMKFNIGFNLPSMSISLPKLELPQISIKASVKNKKPFTLKLPVIKFNGYANTEEDNSHDSGYNYQSNHPTGASYNSHPSPAGPTAYASGSGASGYASATPDAYSSHPQSSSSSGYLEQPASSPSYSTDPNNQYKSNGATYLSSSAYSSNTHGPSVYSGKAQQSVPQTHHYTVNDEQPEYHRVQNGYENAANDYNSRPIATSYSSNSPSEQDNSYYVTSANNHDYQQPRQNYQDETKVSDQVSLYKAASNVYQENLSYFTPSHELPQHWAA